MSGYGGFVPGITAGNVFAHDYQKSLSAAQQLVETQASNESNDNPQYADGTYLRRAQAEKETIDKAPYPEALRRADRRIAKYGGFVEGICSENIYGQNFCDSQEFTRHVNKLPEAKAKAGDPAWWSKKGAKLDAHEGKQKVGYGGFIPGIYSENVHGEDFAEAQRTAEAAEAKGPGEILKPALDSAASQTQSREAEDHSKDKLVPGYAGYVPGIYARGVFGATFEKSQWEAEAALAEDEHPRAPQNFDGAGFEKLREEKSEPNAQMQGTVKVSGYAGFIPNIGSRNLCGENWEEAQVTAKNEDDGMTRSKAKILTGSGPGESLSSHTTALAVPREPPAQKIPGYAGYVPKIYARNVFGQTFKDAQATSSVQ